MRAYNVAVGDTIVIDNRDYAVRAIDVFPLYYRFTIEDVVNHHTMFVAYYHESNVNVKQHYKY